MSRWAVILALLGACMIDQRSGMLEEDVTGGSGSETLEDGGAQTGSEGGIHDAIVTFDDAGSNREGGMDSGSGSSGSGSDGSGSGSDGSGSGSGSGSDGSGSDGSGSGGSGAGTGSGSGAMGNGGDDAGLTDVNNESDTRTNFYSCAGCGTTNGSEAGVLAFGVLIVLRRRRR